VAVWWSAADSVGGNTIQSSVRGGVHLAKTTSLAASICLLDVENRPNGFYVRKRAPS
jgi:hypothetical protein